MKRGGTNVKAILLIMLILLQVGWAVPLAQPKSNQEIHQPNLYDPIYQVGEIHRDEGNYYINNFEKLSKLVVDFKKNAASLIDTSDKRKFMVSKNWKLFDG